MNIHKMIIPTPYAVGDVNAYLLKGEALTLFDAGPKTTEAYDAIKWGLREAGYTMDDVEQVVLTHHHPDHAGWVDAFPKAQILGHAYVDHWMKQTPEFLNYHRIFYQKQLDLQGVPSNYAERIINIRGEMELFGTKTMSHYLNEGDIVPGHPSLRVYYTPGHAQSHLIFVDEETRACIGGDLLLQRVSSNPLVEPPVDLGWERPKSLLQYNESLKRIRDLNVSIVYGGHADEVINASELVTERLQRQHERAMKVLQMLEQPMTVFDVTKQLFAKMYEKQPGLTISETVGQLDYLVANGYVHEQIVDGVFLYIKA